MPGQAQLASQVHTGRPAVHGWRASGPSCEIGEVVPPLDEFDLGEAGAEQFGDPSNVTRHSTAGTHESGAPLQSVYFCVLRRTRNEQYSTKTAS